MKFCKNNLSSLISHLSRFLSHPGVRHYGANTAWLFTEQFLRMIAGVLVGVWVARYLGPEKFGLFSYALALVSIFQEIAKLGLDGIVVRDLVQEPEKRNIYLGTSFWLKLFGGVLTFIIILIIILIQTITSISSSPPSLLPHHFFTETNIYILIIAFGIIFQSFEVIDFYYQATVQLKYISIKRMIRLILSSILKIVLVLIGADLIWFILVSLFDIISLSIIGWLIYRSQGLPNFVRYFDIKIGKKLLKDSWLLLLSGIAILIYTRIDQVMIKNILGDREVGLYSAAIRLVEVWYFIPMIITQSVFPAIVNAKKVSEELYYKRLQQLFSLLIWASILIALPISLFSHQIIYLLYGRKYIEASKVLAISIWASLFVFIGVGSRQFLLVENLQKFSFWRTFYGMIVNIILNFILIPSHGIQGAAIATLISQATAAYLFDIFNKETKKIFFMKTYALIPFRRYKCF